MSRATVAQKMLFYGFDRWGFDAKGWAPRTREKYRWQVRRADAWLAEHQDTTIFAAKPKDLEAYLYSTKANARNRNAVRQGLIAFGDFLMAQGLRDSNPAIGLPRLREPRDLPKALETGEARRILAVLPAFPIEHQVAVLLMLMAGLRREECRQLRWSDVRGNWLRFTGKGSKERVIPIKPSL